MTAASLQRLQRSTGQARVGFKRRGAATVLADLHQAGCGKIRLPRIVGGAPAEAVIINTAGGLTDGDRFEVSASWDEGAAATVTTQAAERVYRSRGGDAVIVNRLDIAPGASALWLPQETILFDGGRFARTLEVDIADSSACLFACESIVFGRGAMGETVTSGGIHDAWRVRVGDQLVFADGFALSDADAPLQAQLDLPVIAGGARAIATALVVARDAGDWVPELRDALSRCNVEAGASDTGGAIVVRALASDPVDLRRALQLLLDAITSVAGNAGPFAAFGRPRVFDC